MRFTSPINKARVDVLVDAEYTVVDGDVAAEGGRWVEGQAITADDTTPTLPAGVTTDQVRGVRFVFTKQDGSIIENPANPVQPAAFTVTRRDDLRTGGAVPSTLLGNQAAPARRPRPLRKHRDRGHLGPLRRRPPPARRRHGRR
ncbi:hypothetical protein G7085_16365 [Tessaracoccus sp. HDW20]|uniref:hypothetical protein n=1 Tax=Tessaracoccus coleopterorum TaxID=2714950 RepID=UPI0018D4CD95|nr:hypothetical protein [Tessaracoccus coleopterorum]NHB85636.1 hypothetical protein [Tessaracoccus coleopterorum]